VCFRYRGNVPTEPLPRNDRGIFTEPLPSKDNRTFTEPLPSNDSGDTDTHKQQRYVISLLLFFQNKEDGLKMLKQIEQVENFKENLSSNTLARD
jgi:hypothetical protein